MKKLFLILFFYGNAYAINIFSSNQLIEINSINENANQIKALAEAKLNITLAPIINSENIQSEEINDFFNQFKNYDLNNNILNFSKGDPVSASLLNYNFQEAKRIVEEKLFFKSCLDILNNGYSEGSKIYTIDLDLLGEKDPIDVYCDMDTNGGGWTVIINNSSTNLNYISQFGITAEISSTFYSHVSYGVGWGNNVSIMRNINMEIEYSQVYITYTGTYNNPSGGLGFFSMTNHTESGSYTLVGLNDSWTDAITGQSLTVNNTTVFDQERTNIINRTDIINRSGNFFNIAMGGFSGYPYTKRYINKLMFR